MRTDKELVDLLLALQANDWDFEKVANSLAYSSPAQTLKLEADVALLRGKIALWEQAAKSGHDNENPDKCTACINVKLARS